MRSLIHSKKLLLILVIFVLSLTIRLYDLNATGGLWDEDIYFSSGYNFILNLKNRDFNPDKWGWNNEHPPLGKYIWGIGAYLSYHLPDNPAYRPKLNYGIPRVYSAILGSLTVALLMLIGWEFFSPLVGISSALFLCLQPQFIAYNKALDLSTPLIFFSTCSLYFFLRLLNKSSNRDLIMCFLFVGLSGATRYDGFLLIPIYLLIALIKDIKGGDDSKLLRKMFLTAPLSLLVLFAIWPWIWKEPIPRLINSLNFQSQHLGETNPLRILIMFAVTQPLLVFVFFLLGLILSIKPKWSSFSQKAAVLWVFLFFLLSSIFKLGSNVRYFIPVFVPASLIAGLGFEYIYYKIRSPKFRLAAVLIILLYLFYSAYKIHPYYLDYYSELLGGVANASKLGFPIGTRNEGIKEVIYYLNKVAPSGALVKIIALQDESPILRSDIIKVSPYGDTAKADGKVYSTLDGKEVLADFWVFNPYYYANDFKIANNPNYKLLYEAKVSGSVPLSSIYQLVK